MKKTFKRFMLALCGTTLCTAYLFAAGNKEKNAGTVTVSGSSSVTPIMEKLAASYEEGKDVRIIINMSSSGAGISDTLNGLNDFGMSSRELKSEEKGLEGMTLCMDGIALIVNHDCAASDVKKDDVKALFVSGTPLPDNIVTAAIGRDASSGTRSAFDELLGIKGEYDKGVATLAETGNVIEAIKGSSNSIGYISYGSLTNSVKSVKLDGIECTAKTIESGTYALQRPFVIVRKEGKQLSKSASAFYDFLKSAEAQSIIAANGYIPIK